MIHKTFVETERGPIPFCWYLSPQPCVKSMLWFILGSRDKRFRKAVDRISLASVREDDDEFLHANRFISSQACADRLILIRILNGNIKMRETG
jgi:hypothetical protein